MSLLPPVGWADVATKQDLHILKQDLAVMESRLRTEFHDAMRKQTIALFTGMITLYGITWATITFGG